MKRYDIINYFIEKNNYKTYLEIGLDQPKNCFDKVNCNYKQSVDPAITKFNDNHRCMTSDEYFDKYKNKEGQTFLSFDIIFIDGLHLSEQAIKDVNNSLECLEENGMIIMHDCNPKNAVEASRNRTTARWNGDVWKAFAHFRATRSDLMMFTVDTDEGCGIIQRGDQEVYTGKYETYDDLEENREEILRLINPANLEKVGSTTDGATNVNETSSSKPFIDVKIPFEPGKRLGYAIDRAMKTVDDWVLILDSDVLLVTPTWYNICIEAIKKVGADAGWITCLTNNIGCPLQKANYQWCNNNDIEEHFQTAKKIYIENKGVIDDCTDSSWKLSGFFILTRKKIYEEIKNKFGFDKDKFIGFDNWYCDRVKELGYKTYIMKDLYVYHSYRRLWKDDFWKGKFEKYE